jgi:hypothetical protein
MFESALRTASIGTSLIVLLSFGLFAVDETRAASGQTAAEVAGQAASKEPDPSPREEQAREKAHTPAREFIDDANDALISPFAVTGAGNGWSQRGVPALLALLAYGFGLSFLARYARGRA